MPTAREIDPRARRRKACLLKGKQQISTGDGTASHPLFLGPTRDDFYASHPLFLGPTRDDLGRRGLDVCEFVAHEDAEGGSDASCHKGGPCDDEQQELRSASNRCWADACERSEAHSPGSCWLTDGSRANQAKRHVCLYESVYESIQCTRQGLTAPFLIGRSLRSASELTAVCYRARASLHAHAAVAQAKRKRQRKKGMQT